MERLKLTKTERDRFHKPKRLEQLQAMDPVEFERYCGYLYRREGFSVATTGATGDEGVDLVLKRRRQTTVVQCKRYSGTVGQPTVRDLYGTMIHNGASRAALVTTGRISPAAERWAGDKPIDLIDGHELVSWARRQRLKNANSNYLGTRAATIGAAFVAVLFLVVGIGSFVLAPNPEPTAAPVAATNTAAPSSGAALPATAAAEAVTTTATAAPAIVSDTTGGGGPRPIGPPEASADLTAPYLTGPPLIDGGLDDWPNAQTIASTFISEQSADWDGSQDLNAWWQLAWDEDFLYLSVSVSDDIHNQTHPPASAYLGDSLIVEIDANRAGDLSEAISPDDFQYILSPGDFGALPAGVYLFVGAPSGVRIDKPATAVEVAVMATGLGYSLEAAIPWSELKLTPAPGLVLGLALNAVDNDRPGAAGQDLTLSNVAGRRPNDPGSWGTLTLQ